MAIIKKFRIKNFKKTKELLRLEKISVYFGKRKILEYLNRCFINPKFIKLATTAERVVAVRKANKEYLISF